MKEKEGAKIKLVGGANQMSLIRDTEEVVKFLEFAGRKSLFNEHAINCRLTACHNIFAVVEEQEDNVEYMLNNLDLLIHRFKNKNTGVLPSTVKVYKSRVKGSLEDYKGWSADPFAWERSLSDKAKHAALQENRREKKVSPPPKKAAKAKAPAVEENPDLETAGTEKALKVSFPLRPDAKLEMLLPPDGITLKELQKLCLFLYPYCTDIDLDSVSMPQFVK